MLISKYDMYLNEDSIAKSQEENKVFHSNSLPILCETQFASKWLNFSWPTVGRVNSIACHERRSNHGYYDCFDHCYLHLLSNRGK